MRSSMRLGLRGRFVAFVSAIVIAFGVVLTSLSVRAQNERLRHELEDRGKLLTTVIAANTTDALAMLEVRELRRIIAEARGQENVLDAVAFDEEGRVLTDGTVVNPRRHELIPEADASATRWPVSPRTRLRSPAVRPWWERSSPSCWWGSAIASEWARHCSPLSRLLSGASSAASMWERPSSRQSGRPPVSC